MPQRHLILLLLAGVSILFTGCIAPPEKPAAPAPGERLAARKIPKRGVSPKDAWRKEILKMGAEPLDIDEEWFRAFPGGRTPHEIAGHWYHDHLMSDLWVKGLVARHNVLAKWQKEMTAWLEENSFDFLDEDKDELKKWKEDQSPPWPGPTNPDG
jgi:hypothetical protein